MPWFPVDDRFHSHPKAAAASLAAIGLWAVAGSWANDHLTDGDVPGHMIPLLSRGATELADELVTVGLWRRTKTGYRFHQWHADGDGSIRNRTRSEVAAEREKKSIGGAIGNHRRWHTGKGTKPDPKCKYCRADQRERESLTDRTTDRTSDEGGDRTPSPPIPSHPIPKRTPPTPQGGSDDDPQFTTFWAAYPLKRDKGHARKAWRAALKRGVDPEHIIKAALRYREDPGRKPDFTAYPGTWLNGERYNDEPSRGETSVSSGGWWDN